MTSTDDLRKLALAATPGTVAHSEQMGADYAKNGANTTNCHFSLFASKEHTRAWERGRDAALAALDSIK